MTTEAKEKPANNTELPKQKQGKAITNDIRRVTANTPALFSRIPQKNAKIQNVLIQMLKDNKSDYTINFKKSTNLHS
jgi:hypothetical protein